MGRLYNLVRVNCSTVGTGLTLACGAATSSAFQTLAGAGGVNGDIAPYTIYDGANVEQTFGTVGGGGTTITRAATPIFSSTGAPLNLSGSAVLAFGPGAGDLDPSFPKLQSGAYRAPITMGPNGNTPTPGTGVFGFFDNPQDCRIQEYGSRSHSAGTGQAAFGLYTSGPNGFPIGTPVHGGALFTPTYSFVFGGYSGLNLVLPKGRIWFAMCLPTGSTASFTEGGFSDTNDRWRKQLNWPLSANGELAGNSNGGLKRTGMTAGTWPSLTDSYADFTSMAFVFEVPNLYIRGA